MVAYIYHVIFLMTLDWRGRAFADFLSPARGGVGKSRLAHLCVELCWGIGATHGCHLPASWAAALGTAVRAAVQEGEAEAMRPLDAWALDLDVTSCHIPVVK